MGRARRPIRPHAPEPAVTGGCLRSGESREAATPCGGGRRHASSCLPSAFYGGNALALEQGGRLGKRRGRRLRLRRFARCGSVRPVRNGTRSCRVGPPIVYLVQRELDNRGLEIRDSLACGKREFPRVDRRAAWRRVSRAPRWQGPPGEGRWGRWAGVWGLRGNFRLTYVSLRVQ